MAAGKFHKGSVVCPACGHAMAPKQIGPHTAHCAAWCTEHGKAWPTFKYDAWAPDKKALFEPTAADGRDYVRCRLCAEHGWDFRFSLLVQHLKAHGMTEAEYVRRHPGAQVRLSKTTDRRKETTLLTYGVDNIARSVETKEIARQTSMTRYGVAHAARSPEANEKRRTTNLERYGAENPFGSTEVRGKIRQRHLDVRGVENPAQDPLVHEHRMKTNLKRYGVEHYLQAPEFKDKVRQTSQERYGTDHPMQSEAIKERLVERFQQVYGVDNPLLVPEIAQKAYRTNLANHGGRHSQQCPEVRAKAKATWMEKYGVDNPSKVAEVRERIRATWMRNYGVPFPPPSSASNRAPVIQTGPERKVQGMTPNHVVFAGDGAYWVQSKRRVRNPDFVVLTEAQVRAREAGVPLNELRVTAVIEVFGDFWHGPTQTGQSRDQHRTEVEQHYAAAGYECLVLWEGEINKHPERVRGKIADFIEAWRAASPKV